MCIFMGIQFVNYLTTLLNLKMWPANKSVHIEDIACDIISFTEQKIEIREKCNFNDVLLISRVQILLNPSILWINVAWMNTSALTLCGINHTWWEINDSQIDHCVKKLPLQWRHNERDGTSNHRRRDCLLIRLFRHRSKITSKLRVTGLCAGNSPGTGAFPSQRASNAENVSIWRLHHASHNFTRNITFVPKFSMSPFR